jgi:hypothetical protein
MKYPLAYKLFFFCLLLSSGTNAQEDVRARIRMRKADYEQKPSIGVVAGYTGFNNTFLEIGAGYQPWETASDFIKYSFAGFLALYEFDPSRKLYGISINAWYLGGPFSCGLGINRYAERTSDTYGIKPMIGISFLRIGVMYGYNFFLTPNSISNLYHNSITFKYYFPVWKKKN